ncbi:hypothetical protein AAFF_G00317790 [Aldrovandia affinis]|uniref:Uncharacterized protein n=1 Tax=Aldrovandia affinis TaxID=143900 RepID=A0AAD7W091_9TELE|nr:hypothetical protein AAFF_G00317790 [Aldrovandia affinis]
MNRDHTSPSSLTWVTTCAALHNVCLPAGDVLEPEDDVDGVQVPPPCPGRNEQQGQGARERLAAQRPAPVQPEQLLHHLLQVCCLGVGMRQFQAAKDWSQRAGGHSSSITPPLVLR